MAPFLRQPGSNPSHKSARLNVSHITLCLIFALSAVADEEAAAEKYQHTARGVIFAR
jgi:hypothetical protein